MSLFPIITLVKLIYGQYLDQYTTKSTDILCIPNPTMSGQMTVSKKRKYLSKSR